MKYNELNSHREILELNIPDKGNTITSGFFLFILTISIEICGNKFLTKFFLFDLQLVGFTFKISFVSQHNKKM